MTACISSHPLEAGLRPLGDFEPVAPRLCVVRVVGPRLLLLLCCPPVFAPPRMVACRLSRGRCSASGSRAVTRTTGLALTGDGGGCAWRFPGLAAWRPWSWPAALRHTPTHSGGGLPTMPPLPSGALPGERRRHHCGRSERAGVSPGPALGKTPPSRSCTAQTATLDSFTSPCRPCLCPLCRGRGSAPPRGRLEFWSWRLHRASAGLH